LPREPPLPVGSLCEHRRTFRTDPISTAVLHWQRYTCGFNANRITSRTAPDGGSAYQYDANGELTSATTPTESFTYDQNGNRTNAGYQTGSYNRLSADASHGYNYDNEGNRAGSGTAVRSCRSNPADSRT
jgi:YD repeat-containing protein